MNGPRPKNTGPPAPAAPAHRAAPLAAAPPVAAPGAAPAAGAGSVIANPVRSPEELREEYSRLRRAVNEEPENTGHRLLLADVCLRLNRKEEGKVVAVQAVERDPQARAPMVEVLRRHLTESEVSRMSLAGERIPFHRDAGGVLRYPLRGNGPPLIIGGGLLFTGLVYLACFSFRLEFPLGLFFWIPGLGAVGFLTSYMMAIIESAGHGNQDPPDYPDFTNIWDSVLGPFCTAVCASLIPAVPPAAYWLLVGADFGLAPFVALGLVYLPMALIAGTILQSSLAALNLPLVVKAMRAAGKEYFLGVGVIYGLVLLNWLAREGVYELLPSIFAEAIAQTVGLYFLLVEMHILGRIYLNHDRAIGWFQKKDEKEAAAEPGGGEPRYLVARPAAAALGPLPAPAQTAQRPVALPAASSRPAQAAAPEPPAAPASADPPAKPAPRAREGFRSHA